MIHGGRLGRGRLEATLEPSGHVAAPTVVSPVSDRLLDSVVERLLVCRARARAHVNVHATAVVARVVDVWLRLIRVARRARLLARGLSLLSLALQVSVDDLGVHAVEATVEQDTRRRAVQALTRPAGVVDGRHDPVDGEVGGAVPQARVASLNTRVALVGHVPDLVREHEAELPVRQGRRSLRVVPDATRAVRGRDRAHPRRRDELSAQQQVAPERVVLDQLHTDR